MRIPNITLDSYTKLFSAHCKAKDNIEECFSFRCFSFKYAVLGWPKHAFCVQIKIKDIFFIFTKNFTKQHIHSFVPLPSAIFQAIS